ncbi:Mammalian cell entry related domain protein [Leptothrix cholodnii SP-6]|uniref:Mammalian cell entry related domain protein n=1 Tax=Leptothrix cholodnii (strain ATCC 51168 / LMG 8142 / SP-6) TaxID=395495 RepID=B1XY79_LEPCP|nr:MlaD family protein [Leptothrix cholodnii]ACB33980.1 Mammalian cell entry related domain protein [Leptothrix cholodnii SP-6]
MTPRPHALRIGLFAIGGLALLVMAVASVFGGRLFADSERAVLHFNGSIYGLQIGAPVVFRGVRMGGVVSIGLVNDAQGAGFQIPVVVELDSELLRSLQGRPAGAASAADADAAVLPALVARGLSGQLAMQSLLTGLLYVDLDLRPDGSTARYGRVPDGMVEIPTTATRLQTLQAQLEGLDFGQLAKDLSAIAATTRGFVASPELRQSLDDLAQTSGSLRRLSATLERRAGPLADGVGRALAQTGQAADQVGAAASRAGTAVGQIGAAAEQIGATTRRADAVIAQGPPLMRSLQQAADELSRTAVALRQATSADAGVVQNADRALADVARAARAVRELAELLEQQPESLIRGRRDPP